MSEKGKSKMLGKQSLLFDNPPVITGYSSVVGKKEGEGPLGKYFDLVEKDPLLGKNSWEEAESCFQKKAADMAMAKAGVTGKDIRYLVAGDLLGQLIATSFGILEYNIPLFGIYGACSTMGEGISIGAMLTEGGFADCVLALTSSHYASAEKQFRFPLGYGNQRPLAATWTVTGSGAVVIKSGSSENKKGVNPGDAVIIVKGITTGKIVDYGIKDSMNMGAAMAPAAANVITANLDDYGIKPAYYDKIITGDLGYVGKDILLDLMKAQGKDISENYMDCGIEIFDREEQDTHSGGSGCACSAVTLTGYVFQKLAKKEWTRVLFIPTGALLSPVSFNEGNPVPGIAHGVIFEAI